MQEVYLIRKLNIFGHCYVTRQGGIFNAELVNGASKSAPCHCQSSIASCSHNFRECVVCFEDSPFNFLSEELTTPICICVYAHVYMLRLFYD